MNNSKFDTKAARVIAAQLYVAKGLKRNPGKMIKFMKVNKDYFPNISNEILNQMQIEHNLTDFEIDQQENIEFANIKAEENFEKELLEKAEKIDKLRKTEKRDYRGKGESTIYKSRTEAEADADAEVKVKAETELKNFQNLEV